MAEEYIIKLKEHDQAEIIPKEQWDGSKDKETFKFIPLGEGKYTEIIGKDNKIEDIKEYIVTFGLMLDINNERDPGYLFYIYQYGDNKYTWEWVRMIRGALRFEAKALLKDKKVWDAITTAVNTIVDPEALAEFKRIIETIALGNVIIEYLEDHSIKIEELNTKKYFYRIYKYALKGKFDFDTFNSLVGLEYSSDWVTLDANLIESLQFRVEMAYDNLVNKN